MQDALTMDTKDMFRGRGIPGEGDESAMLCVGLHVDDEEGAPAEPLLWVHTMQGRLLLAAEGGTVHRAEGMFAPVAALDGPEVGRFIERFDRLTRELFMATERPVDRRSSTPVRVAAGHVRALMADVQS